MIAAMACSRDPCGRIPLVKNTAFQAFSGLAAKARAPSGPLAMPLDTAAERMSWLGWHQPLPKPYKTPVRFVQLSPRALLTCPDTAKNTDAIPTWNRRATARYFSR